MVASSTGITNVVALMRASCSDAQTNILLAKTTNDARIIVIPDRDQAGERFLHSVMRSVDQHRWLKWVRFKDGEQPTDCTPNEINQFIRA